jgi:hypothetical protein
MSLKRIEPAIRFGGTEYFVTPDEEDSYKIYNIVNPGTSNTFWATAGTAGTSAVVALTISNRYPDYPRSIRFALPGSTAGLGGTLVVKGLNQFGETQNGTMTLAGSTNGGTMNGTLVWARLDSGTVSYGTSVGNGTPAIGFVTGTACLFGLPVKLGGTSDVVFMSHAAGTGAVSFNGGTIAAYVNKGQSAIQPAAAVTGTESINVWIKSTYNSEGTSYARLTQAT